MIIFLFMLLLSGLSKESWSQIPFMEGVVVVELMENVFFK